MKVYIDAGTAAGEAVASATAAAGSATAAAISATASQNAVGKSRYIYADRGAGSTNDAFVLVTEAGVTVSALDVYHLYTWNATGPNTTDTPTANINGLGVKTLRTAVGGVVPVGTYTQGTHLGVRYNAATDELRIIFMSPVPLATNTTPDFVTLDIVSQIGNTFVLSDSSLPANVGDVALAWILTQEPALDSGWSAQVVNHPQLSDPRAITWPGTNDQIDNYVAKAGQLVIVTYNENTGKAFLQYPFRPSGSIASSGGNSFYTEQNARIGAQLGVENSDAIAALDTKYKALALRTSPDVYASDEITLDFARGYYDIHGEQIWGIKSAPGFTYSRTGIKGELDGGQIRQMEAANPAIIKGQGYWSRKAATNILLNSATLVTQNVTVTAVQHTLSFLGTGTVTLTGVSTAGPLVGTGRRNRVKISFTPTAGTLTLTISGDVQMASLVIGDSEGSLIQTLATPVAVAADSLSLTAALDDEPWLIFVVADMQQAGVTARLMVLDDGTNPNRITFGRTAGNDLSVQVLRDNVAQTIAGPAGSTINGIGKIAIGLRRDAAGRFSAAHRYANGTVGIGTPVTVAAMLQGIRRLSVGHYSTGEQPQSPISLIRIIHGDFTNAQITAVYEGL